jgi:hypothetical protein
MPTTRHYLTRDGWLEGDIKSESAVECWERDAYWANGKLTIDYSLRWTDTNWSVEERDALRQKFDLPEAQVSGAVADVTWEIPD